MFRLWTPLECEGFPASPKRSWNEQTPNILAPLPAGMWALVLGSANQMHSSGILNLKLMTQRNKDSGDFSLVSVTAASSWQAQQCQCCQLLDLALNTRDDSGASCRPSAQWPPQLRPNSQLSGSNLAGHYLRSFSWFLPSPCLHTPPVTPWCSNFIL